MKIQFEKDISEIHVETEIVDGNSIGANWSWESLTLEEVSGNCLLTLSVPNYLGIATMSIVPDLNTKGIYKLVIASSNPIQPATGSHSIPPCNVEFVPDAQDQESVSLELYSKCDDRGKNKKVRICIKTKREEEPA
jgi:hypothetical protein